MNFMTHSSEEAFRLQLHRELRLASGLRGIRFSHAHKMKSGPERNSIQALGEQLPAYVDRYPCQTLPPRQ
jgi:hypothetical protein